VRVILRKISDTRYALALARADGRREDVELETRSVLEHDFIHFAVEAEARLAGGFWGLLARGATLAQMNDRVTQMGRELADVELVVGALSGIRKGVTPADLVAGIRSVCTQLEGTAPPSWLDEPFVVAVQERLRRLMGHWKATRFGGEMELVVDWVPES
jgi:hypothetical protein